MILKIGVLSFPASISSWLPLNFPVKGKQRELRAGKVELEWKESRSAWKHKEQLKWSQLTGTEGTLAVINARVSVTNSLDFPNVWEETEKSWVTGACIYSESTHASGAQLPPAVLPTPVLLLCRPDTWNSVRETCLLYLQKTHAYKAGIWSPLRTDCKSH